MKVYTNERIYDLLPITDGDNVNRLLVDPTHLQKMMDQNDRLKAENKKLRRRVEILEHRLEHDNEWRIANSRLNKIESALKDLHSQCDLGAIINVLGREKE